LFKMYTMVTLLQDANAQNGMTKPMACTVTNLVRTPCLMHHQRDATADYGHWLFLWVCPACDSEEVEDIVDGEGE